MPKAELEGILCRATFAETTQRSSDAQNQHVYELCQKLHPREPSCLKNYLQACLTESLRTARWFAAVSALPILLSSHQRRMITKYDAFHQVGIEKAHLLCLYKESDSNPQQKVIIHVTRNYFYIRQVLIFISYG